MAQEKKIDILPEFSCLSAEARQKIAITIKEKNLCKEDLAEISKNDEPPMKNLIVAFLLGSVLTFGAALAVHK